jgi:hypothetical protein
LGAGAMVGAGADVVFDDLRDTRAVLDAMRAL